MATDTLFRLEALTAKREKHLGSVILKLPVLYRILTLLVVVFVITLFAFAFFGSYSRHQATKGMVSPINGMLKIRAARPGTVKQLFVAKDQIVTQGQVLMTIDTGLGLNGGEKLEKQQLSQLHESILRLGRIRQQQIDLGRAEQDRLTKRLERLKKKFRNLTHDLALVRRKATLLQRQATGARKLSREGAVSRQGYEGKQLSALDAKLRLEEFSRTIDDLENEITEVRAEKSQKAIAQSIKLGDYDKELAGLKRSVLEMEGREGYSITSPRSGRLVVLQVEEGQQVDTRTPIAALVAEDARYEVDLLLPSQAIGLVQEGNSVRLRYQAFPFQRYGLQKGRITNITGAGLAGEEMQDALNLPREPYFKVKVSLEKQSIDAYGKSFPLRPGMLVDADVILDTVPIWYWFLEPILTLKGRL